MAEIGNSTMARNAPTVTGLAIAFETRSKTAADLQRMMVAELIGRPVRASVWRDGSDVELTLVPDELEQAR